MQDKLFPRMLFQWFSLHLMGHVRTFPFRLFQIYIGNVRARTQQFRGYCSKSIIPNVINMVSGWNVQTTFIWIHLNVFYRFRFIWAGRRLLTLTNILFWWLLVQHFHYIQMLYKLVRFNISSENFLISFDVFHVIVNNYYPSNTFFV